MRWVDFKDSVKRFWNDYKREKSGMFGLILLVILIVLAVSAPYLTSPDVPQKWQVGWQTNPKNAPPTWVNRFSSISKAPHLVYSVKDVHITRNSSNGYTTYVLTFAYKNKYYLPPKDVVITGILNNASTPSQNPQMTLWVIRPPERGIKNNTMLLISGYSLPSNYTFQLSSSQDAKLNFLFWLYKNGAFKLNNMTPILNAQMLRLYLTMNNTLMQTMGTVDLVRALMGQLVNKSTGKFVPLTLINNVPGLEGLYTFKVYITAPQGVKLNFNHMKIYFVGRTYGILGTDQMGRPIAVGLLWGTRVALAIGISVSVTSVLLGIFIGVTSAYLGGWKDELIQRFTEFMASLPLLPMLILLSLWIASRSAAQSSKITLWQLVAIMVIFGWMGTEKIARSMALQIKEQTYVEAARALGAGTGRIVFKHIVPQLLPYAFASMALSVPGAILAEAGLSFLNLTSQNMVSWGRMLNNAYNNGATVNGYWWQVIPPGLAIAIVGFVFVLIGVSLDKVLNPKLRRI